MADDIRRSERGGNTAYLNIGAWYDEASGQIHLTLPRSGWFHTTVNAQDGSIRRHKNLFDKLARALQEAGISAPATAQSNNV